MQFETPRLPFDAVEVVRDIFEATYQTPTIYVSFPDQRDYLVLGADPSKDTLNHSRASLSRGRTTGHHSFVMVGGGHLPSM